MTGPKPIPIPPPVESEPNLMRERIENDTFRNGVPSALNACVGENGSPDAIVYARGYASAATLLLDRVVEDWAKTNNAKLHPDEFVYPICFSMRHAVELYLKAAVQSLTDMSEHRPLPGDEIDLKTTHDLHKLWRFLTAIAPAIDRRLPPLLASMERHVTDIADVDATGQVFRYPYDTENRKHLVDVSIINVRILREQFGKLEGLLEDLFRLYDELDREYKRLTYTRSLSRHDLSEIAERLLPRNQWRNAAFAGVRDGVKRDYELSSRECTAALKLIEGNYQLAAKIGMELPLAYLKEADLFFFLDVWCNQNDIAVYKETWNPAAHADFDAGVWMVGEELGDDIAKSHEKLMADIVVLEQALTIEALSEIKALFYFSYDTTYSEDFVRDRERYRNNYTTGLDQPREGIQELLEMVVAMQYILRSLHALGQNSLVSKISTRYELEEHLQYIF